MAISISINKNKHRFDSATLPQIGGAGWQDTPQLFIRNYLLKNAVALPYIWTPANRTDATEVALRDTAFGGWTLSAGVMRDPGDNRFTKTGADSFSGAVGNVLNNVNCSVEGKPMTTAATCTLALQSGTDGFNFLNDEMEHALVLGQNGSGSIRELGVVKEKNAFVWATGDKGFVELYNGIVRYYLVKPDGSMKLLRSTRSRLTAAVKPTVGIFHAGGVMENVVIWFGPEAKTPVQVYGVLKNFQNWGNKASWESLAERTTNKDKSQDFTYFTVQSTLKSISLSVDWDEGDAYRQFVEFFKWHDQSREFIFADQARGDEFFARAVSSFSDAPLGADTFGMAADIQEMINPPNLIGL